MLLDETPERWAKELMKGARLGDVRRNESAAVALATMGHHAGESLPQMCKGNQALYTRLARFARNDNCKPEEILAACCDRSASEVASHPGTILALGDTTFLSWPHESVEDELGYTTGGPQGAKGQGALAHSVIAMSGETYEVLGLIDQMYGIRDPANYGCKAQRANRPYEEKESFKWEASLERCSERLAEALERCVFINDREADIYEYLMAHLGAGTRFIVRAAQNRTVEEAEFPRLYEQVDKAPLRAMATVFVPQQGGRSARYARLEVRACAVTLTGTKRIASLPSLKMNAVALVEVSPPEGIEPIEWLLLTSEPIETLANIECIVRWYACRWGVEEFHKCWKSEVEELRLQSAQNLMRIAVLMAFTAIRIIRLRAGLLGEEFERRAPVFETIEPQAPQASNLPESPSPNEQPPTAPSKSSFPAAALQESSCLNEQTPTAPGNSASPTAALQESPCTDVLTPLQWRVLWLTNHPQKPLPQTPPSRRWAMCAVAKLGGWLDTKRTGRPGYGTLWKGWKRLEERVEAACLAKHLEQALLEEM